MRATTLVVACRAAGAIRDDVEPLDLLRFGHGLAVVAGSGDDADRPLDVVLAGLQRN